MKKFFNRFAALVSLTAVLVSCAKEIETVIENTPDANNGKVEIIVNASSVATKTFIDGTAVKWGATDEYLKVLQNKDGAVTNETSSQGVTSDEGATMQFGVSFTEATGTSFKYYAFYPASALNGTPGVNATKINTPAAQTPTATSFDPAADLLIAKEVDNGSTQATNLDMQFTRAVAVGKMTLTNLVSSDPVKKVIFSAKNGSTSINLAGRTEFDLQTAAPTGEYANNVPETSIILDYSALSLTANESMDVFFTCYPFDLADGDSFTVAVQTASKTYTRTVSLSGAQVLSFTAGKASRFSVNMSTAVATDNAIDLRYACLTGAEYNTAGGTTSYGNITVSKPHGDKWATYAQYTSSSIGIRNNASTNDSYVKLPDLVENIKTVIVTFASSSSDNTKKITLETTATGKSGDIMSKNFGDMDASNKVTFDLTSLGSTYKTAYVRANGAQAVVSKIEVYAGEDTRAATAPAPATVTAEVNGSDPNTIDVSWAAASGAAGYIVTLTPTEGAAVVKNAAANVTSISFDALPASTTFTPSVVTVADPYIHKANSASQAGENVSTGAAAITNIAGIKAKWASAATAFSATLTNALVTIVSGDNFYLQDDSGAILVYTSGHGLNPGDKLTGAVSGTVTKYQSNFEITGFTSTAEKSTGNAVNPSTVAHGTLVDNFGDYESEYVKVSSLTVSAVNGKDLSVSENANLKIRNETGSALPVGCQINAVGIACYFNSTKQVKLFSLAEADKISIVSQIDASNKSVAVGGTVSIGATKNTPQAITYVSGNNSIATVTSEGVITGVATGSTTITMTTEASGVYSAAEKEITVTVNSGNVTDVLTATLINVTSYSAWTGKTSNSSAVYAGYSTANSTKTYIQLKSGDNSGIITTTSGGKVKKITVTWDDSTADGRTLQVYGKNTAYSSSSSASELYASGTRGTSLGTIVKGTSTQLTVSGDYQYIGLRSSSGAMYITEIRIEWEPSE